MTYILCLFVYSLSCFGTKLLHGGSSCRKHLNIMLYIVLWRQCWNTLGDRARIRLYLWLYLHHCPVSFTAFRGPGMMLCPGATLFMATPFMMIHG